MKPGDIAYLGDGAYLYFSGYDFEFRANHPEQPSDRVYIESRMIPLLITILQDTLKPQSRHREPVYDRHSRSTNEL
jgi:hypothetical protein